MLRKSTREPCSARRCRWATSRRSFLRPVPHLSIHRPFLAMHRQFRRVQKPSLLGHCSSLRIQQLFLAIRNRILHNSDPFYLRGSQPVGLLQAFEHRQSLPVPVDCLLILLPILMRGRQFLVRHLQIKLRLGVVRIGRRKLLMESLESSDRPRTPRSPARTGAAGRRASRASRIRCGQIGKTTSVRAPVWRKTQESIRCNRVALAGAEINRWRSMGRTGPFFTSGPPTNYADPTIRSPCSHANKSLTN